MNFSIGDIVYLQRNIDIERKHANLPIVSFNKEVFNQPLIISEQDFNSIAGGFQCIRLISIEDYLIPITAISYKQDNLLNKILPKLPSLY